MAYTKDLLTLLINIVAQLVYKRRTKSTKLSYI